MGAFDKFRSAEPMGVRKYIEEGESILLIQKIRMAPSENPKKKGVEKTVVEFKIMETNSEKMKAGNRCSLVEMDDKEGYYGNLLEFVAGVLGVTTDDLKADEDFETYFEAIFGEQQMFTGLLVKCTAQKTTTQAGGDYTAKSWEAVPASQYEQYGLVAPQGAYGAEAAAA